MLLRRCVVSRSRSCATLLFAFTSVAACSRSADTSTNSVAPSTPRPPWFEEQAVERGLVFRHRSGADGRFQFPETVCGGAALFDMDGDGDLDAFVVQGGALDRAQRGTASHALFENRGGGRFTDVTSGSGVESVAYGVGVAAGDYDGDGDVDLYVCGYGQDVLLQNDGGGKFHDVAIAAGIVENGLGASAAFVDYDRDGDLDLFVVNYLNWSPNIEVACYTPSGERTYCNPRNYDAASPSRLYRNRGDGTFDDVTTTSGIGAARGNGLGVVCADFDGDGNIDLFVANDGTPNHLWLNRGNGQFEERAQVWGCAVDRNGATQSGMGTDVADLDDDGDWDLIVGNLANELDGLLENSGRWFTERTGKSGLAQLSRPHTRFGLGFYDFDLDGWTDLYEADGRVTTFDPRDAHDPFAEVNLLVRGTGPWRFEAVEPRGGTRDALIATSRGAAFGDIDDDGRVDILVVNRDGPVHLLHNVAAPGGRWLRVRAVDERGHDALGAVVSVQVADRTLRRMIKPWGSFASSSDPRAHFGLGQAPSSVEVAVIWLGGSRESFGMQATDHTITLRQGEGRR